MNLRGYVRALRRHAVLIALCVVVSTAVISTAVQFASDTYESRARVIVSSAQSEIGEAYTAGLLSAQRAGTYVQVLKSRLVAQRVRDELGMTESLSDVIGKVEASVVPDTSVIELKVRESDPAVAQELAQSYAEQLVAVAADIETPADGSNPPTTVTVIDSATFNAQPVAPKPILYGVLAAMLGLIVGVSIALLRELLDTSISSTEDLESVTDLPVLGSIAHEGANAKRRLVSQDDLHTQRVEAFRVLRTNVQFVDVDSSHKSIVVTSSMKEEGKTSTAANLAIALALNGARTLLVDGDLRRPQVAELFGIDGSIGVTTVLLGKVSLRDAIVEHADSGLHLLPSGVVPPNPAELLQTHAMERMMAEVKNEYDIVIIDTPPLLPVTDAAILSAGVDATLLVVRHARSKRPELRTALERLNQVNAVPVGVVLNDIPLSRERWGYGGYAAYGSYISYGSRDQVSSSRDDAGARRARRGRSAE
ncbi:polysaccharide biosynthesis tyrosine autokinase [Nocardioides sp. R-C-SC26]|uniref:polysaccharide biosynthesis tyrosine autokinase n=1 Tax=Nocardioides sp. R-C-SC26 TaxID=2870414 RepID=UPI001E49E14C|nr:polysaccharide biosynthesis tyrosine autokinase [Nocardioides sp. R-C-SC26]